MHRELVPGLVYEHWLLARRRRVTTLTERMRECVPHDQRQGPGPPGHVLRKVGICECAETGDIPALAARVIETAVKDAVGLSNTRAKQYQDVRSHFGRVDGALDWLRVTVAMSDPGTLGFWSAVAGLDARAILEAVEMEIERLAA